MRVIRDKKTGQVTFGELPESKETYAERNKKYLESVKIYDEVGEIPDETIIASYNKFRQARENALRGVLNVPFTRDIGV